MSPRGAELPPAQEPGRRGSHEGNALQRMADVVIQDSVREGFGSIVSEALWKGTAVIAAPSGGIPAQIEHGLNGYLAESVTSSPIACASCSRTGSGSPARRGRGPSRARAVTPHPPAARPPRSPEGGARRRRGRRRLRLLGSAGLGRAPPRRRWPEQEAFPGAVDHAVSPLEANAVSPSACAQSKSSRGRWRRCPTSGRSVRPRGTRLRRRSSGSSALVERMPARASPSVVSARHPLGLTDEPAFPPRRPASRRPPGPARTPASALRRVCRALRTATRLVGPPAG